MRLLRHEHKFRNIKLETLYGLTSSDHFETLLTDDILPLPGNTNKNETGSKIQDSSDTPSTGDSEGSICKEGVERNMKGRTKNKKKKKKDPNNKRAEDQESYPKKSSKKKKKTRETGMDPPGFKGLPGISNKATSNRRGFATPAA